MNAFIDARCSKCNARIGWCGTVAQRPACAKCGHRPPQAELDTADAKMEEVRRLLELSPHKASGEELRRQRILAGLTLRQAAKIIGESPSVLSSWEMGRAAPTEKQASTLANAYGINVENESSDSAPVG